MSKRDGLGVLGWTLVIAGIVALWAGLSLLVAWAFWALWNWIVPDLFHGPCVTYWQAVGLMALLGFVRGVVTINNRRGSDK